jgi:hypothetical protein
MHLFSHPFSVVRCQASSTQAWREANTMSLKELMLDVRPLDFQPDEGPLPMQLHKSLKG